MPRTLFSESLNTACYSPICDRVPGVSVRWRGIRLTFELLVCALLCFRIFSIHTVKREEMYIYLKTHTHHTILLTVTCLSCYCLAIAYNSIVPHPLAGTNHRLILPCWDINLLGTKRATLCCLMAAVWLREAFFCCYYIQLLSLHLATSLTSLC